MSYTLTMNCIHVLIDFCLINFKMTKVDIATTLCNERNSNFAIFQEFMFDKVFQLSWPSF